MFEDDSSRPDLPTIKIQDLPSDNLTLDIDCIEETDFGDVFIEETDNSSLPNETMESKEILTLTTNNLEEHNELVADTIDSNSLSIKENDDNSSIISQKLSDSSDENSEVSSTDEDESENTETSESDEGSSDDSSEESEEEIINAYFPEFPVQLICMEACSDTLDQLILDDKMSEKLWLSALMQIIMTLITYQKVFSFTHNDLHTNNVMYVSTKKKFVYYCFKGVHYKVPTYGKIFKIIDFGRAIYKHDGKIMCSDSFSPTGDAATQYNIEPYYNPKKPRLEPNYSFDLCRLACSIFDYFGR